MRNSAFGLRLMVFAVLAGVAACGAPDDSVGPDDYFVSVATDDPEMTLAIAEVREALEHFWQVFEAPIHGERGFALKVRIEDRGSTEHLWVTDLRREHGKVYGRVGNDANTVTGVKFGDEIEVLEKNVTDWLYMRDGKMVGNFTVRPLFKKMRATEVERIKTMMAQP